MSHNPGNLVQVSQIVRGPSREKLGESHAAERRMQPATLQIHGLKIQGAQGREIL